MSRMQLAGLLLVAVVLRPSWSPSTEARAAREILDHTHLRPVQLSGRVLSEADDFGLPSDLVSMGEDLVVVDMFAAPAVHVLDRQSGRRREALGSLGEGPGEFMSPVALDPAEGGGGVWVHDVRLQRITYVPLQPPDVGQDQVLTVPLHGEGPVIDVVWTGSTVFLGHGFFSSGRLAAFEEPGRPAKYLGPVPENPWEAPIGVLQHAYQGTLEARPDRQLLALAARHAGGIEIFEATGEFVRRFSGPFPFEPRFDVDRRAERPRLSTGPNLRFGYIDLAVTQDWLWALFSGRTRARFPERANYAAYVHVFDWDGQLQAVLHLDEDAFAIAVDPTVKILYAIRHEPVPGILAFSIPRLGAKKP